MKLKEEKKGNQKKKTYVGSFSLWETVSVRGTRKNHSNTTARGRGEEHTHSLRLGKGWGEGRL